MRRVVFAALLASIAWAAPASARERLLTVEQLREAINKRDAVGSEAMVRGFISPGCYILSCGLTSSLRAEVAVGVSLAGGTQLEPDIMARQGHLVMMRVRIGLPASYTDDNGGIHLSTDRAPEAIPLEIID